VTPPVRSFIIQAQFQSPGFQSKMEATMTTWPSSVIRLASYFLTSYRDAKPSVTVSWSRCEAHLHTGETDRWCLLLKVGADSWYYEFNKLEEAFRPFAEFIAGSPKSLSNQTLEEGEKPCKEISKSTD